jgi:hypothetical protein
MDKNQLKCQYIYINTGKKGQVCNNLIRQQTIKNTFENGCYYAKHVQQRKKYNFNKETVSRPKKNETQLPSPCKNLQLEIFNFETKKWEINTKLSKLDVFELLTEYPKSYVQKIIKYGFMNIYPHITITKIRKSKYNKENV